MTIEVAPIFGAYKELIDRLLDQNQKMPRKQRYTTHKIYEQVQAAGYTGSESGVRGYVAQKRKENVSLTKINTTNFI